MPNLTVNQVKNICRNMIKVRGATVSGTIALMPAPPTNTVVQFDPTPIWEGNNYFDAGHPTRVTVPNRRGGRYFIHAELQWKPRIGTDIFSVGQSNGGFFGAFIVRNGMTTTSQREARSIAPVIAGSSLVTHNVILETHLSAGDYVELFVFQRVTGVDPNLDFPVEVKATLTVRRLGRSA
jgi:hypothetical protein